MHFGHVAEMGYDVVVAYLAGGGRGCIVGFVTVDDVLEHDVHVPGSEAYQREDEVAPGFRLVGTWLITRTEVGHFEARLQKRMRGGEPRQNSRVAAPTAGIKRCLSHLGQDMGWAEGIVFSDAPQGVVLLCRLLYSRVGGVMEAWIEDVGREQYRLFECR